MAEQESRELREKLFYDGEKSGDVPAFRVVDIFLDGSAICTDGSDWRDLDEFDTRVPVRIIVDGRLSPDVAEVLLRKVLGRLGYLHSREDDIPF